MAFRVRLNKRRNKTGKPTNTRLDVKYRELNTTELKQQRMRLNGLKHVIEEDGEEEEGLNIFVSFFTFFSKALKCYRRAR